MRKIESSGIDSLKRSVLRALGMDRAPASPSLSLAETKVSDSVSYLRHDSAKTALLEAEQAKAKAIMFMEHRERVVV